MSNSHAPTSTHLLKQGARVIIMKTDNAMLRAPEMIGQVGEIKAVPQHPNTWFKVKFSNGKVFTLRPSALRLYRDNDAKDAGGAGESGAAAGAGAANGAGGAPGGGPGGGPGGLGLLDATDTSLLSATDADSWVGRQVMVKTGKSYGTVGVVQGSGNGWVQLQTSSGMTAKRAYELELVASEADAAARVERARKQEAAAKAAKAAAAAAGYGDDGGGGGGGGAAQQDGGVAAALAAGGILAVHHAGTLLRKRVRVPDGRVGLVTKVERSTCTVRINDERLPFTKEQLILVAQNTGKDGTTGKGPGRPPSSSAAGGAAGGGGGANNPKRTPRQVSQAQYRQRVHKLMAKMRDRVQHRPNLHNFLDSLAMKEDSEEDNDSDAVDLEYEVVCPACGAEVQTGESCWNEFCRASSIGQAASAAARGQKQSAAERQSDSAAAAEDAANVIRGKPTAALTAWNGQNNSLMSEAAAASAAASAAKKAAQAQAQAEADAVAASAAAAAEEAKVKAAEAAEAAEAAAKEDAVGASGRTTATAAAAVAAT